MVYNIRNEPFWNDFHDGMAQSGWIRDGDFKYGRIWLYDGVVFDILYDLKNDPTEKDNIAFEKEHEQQLQKMKDMFDDLAASMVPADEPFCGNCLASGWLPPADYFVNNYITHGWCGNGLVNGVNQTELYNDPCTSGPCTPDYKV